MEFERSNPRKRCAYRRLLRRDQSHRWRQFAALQFASRIASTGCKFRGASDGLCILLRSGSHFRFHLLLTAPVRGDQFEQKDKRWVGGLDARHTIFSTWLGHDVQNTFGLQVRNDWINNGLYQTQNRERVNKFDVASGTTLPATTESDRFTDTQVGLYVENRIQWTDKFRSVEALRGDFAYYDVTCLNNPVNSGTSTNFLPEPKLSLIFGPWEKAEFYVSGGFGYHSNDARGATQTVQPVSADNPNPGTPVQRIPGLIQTQGAEIGTRILAVPHLQSTIAFWYLHSESDCSKMATRGVPSPLNSRAIATVSNGRTTSRQQNIWRLTLISRIPLPGLLRLMRPTQRQAVRAARRYLKQSGW